MKLFDRPSLYEHFHRIISRKKFLYIRRFLESRRDDRRLKVIDFGCGPGTNAFLFTDKKKYEYLGVDINPDYITWAQRRYDLKFVCGDLTELKNLNESFDLVLVNSVMHHLTNLQAEQVLAAARTMLAQNGECVVLDMIRPDVPRISNLLQRILIRLDRGTSCRKMGELEGLLKSYFSTEVAYAFDIRFIVCFWQLKLFLCRPR